MYVGWSEHDFVMHLNGKRHQLKFAESELIATPSSSSFDSICGSERKLSSTVSENETSGQKLESENLSGAKLQRDNGNLPDLLSI